MNLYTQEPEVGLLAAFVSRLDNRSAIDVGAERGAFVAELLRAGSDDIHAIEAERANVESLRSRFRGDARVSVHEYAVRDSDGRVELHRAIEPRTGTPLSYGHTVLERAGTDEIAWGDTVVVPARSLASLVADRVLPARVGILKVDTEGGDFAVVAGMGELECDVVMVEHWLDLPNSLGPCPWTTEQMASALARRGFSHFAFLEHRDEFVILKWDDAAVSSGNMGNLVFLHDRVLEDLLPTVLECASALAAGAVAVGEMYATAARERLDMIDVLNRECERRLRLIEELSASATS